MKIAICGKMGSGKSTAANFLKELYPEFYITSFAKKLKIIAKELFNMTIKDRTLLIQIGTKMKEINPDVWANYTLKEIKDNNKTHVIIDDLRFKNEYFLLKKHNFKIIKLHISKKLQLKYLQKRSKHINQLKDNIKHLDSSTENDIDTFENNFFDLVIDCDKDDIFEKLTMFFKNNK